MPAPEDAPFPFDALSEGVAAVGGDGALAACNEAMRALLAVWSPGEVERERLAAGDVLRVTAGGREHDVARSGDWLVARAVAADDRAVTAELAAARVRLFGALASSIAHDLANLLGSAMGLASLLESAADDVADRRLVGELQRGAARGAVMMRALARMLKRSPRDREVANPIELLEGARALSQRAAAARKVEIAVEVAPDPAPIRIVMAEAQQALMLGIVALLDGGPPRIEVAVANVRAAPSGGRERACVRVRLAARGCTDPVGGDAAPADWQVTAALALAGVGGAFAVDAQGDGCVVDYVWPAVRSA